MSSSSPSPPPPPQWSTLLPELLLSVAERLHIADIARLPAVCRHWAWTLGRPSRGYPPPPPNLLHLDNSMPWMLLPNEHREEADHLSFQLADRSSKGTISPLPEMVGRRCMGSSPDGSWLVTLDLTLDPRILNPLTRKEFPLPSLLTIPTDNKAIFDGSDGSVLEFVDYKYQFSYPVNLFRDSFIRKIIITGAPPNAVAVVLYGINLVDTHMALARPGDACWIPIPKAKWFKTFTDVFYHQEDQRLYAVTCVASVVVFNLCNFINSSSLSPPAPRILTPALNVSHKNMLCVAKYLVFLDGELLQIWRSLNAHSAKGYNSSYACEGYVEEFDDPIIGIDTYQIEVMKLVPVERRTYDPPFCWVKVEDLGNYSLFIGCNHTRAVSVSKNSGLRPNCVYFTDDSHGQCDIVEQRKECDFGVYDIKNETLERFLHPGSDQQVFWPPPSWFMPPQLHVTLPN